MVVPTRLPEEAPGGDLLTEHATWATTVGSDTSCDEVSRLFHDDPCLGCVLVLDEDKLGIVSRTPFALAMVGPLGYGRALHGRRPIGVLTNWDPVIVTSDTNLEHASELVLERGEGGFPPDLVVRMPDGSHKTATSGVVFAGLAAGFAYRARHDHLTGLPNRDLFLRRLHHVCVDAQPRTVAVFYLDLDGFKAVNDQFGHGIGDLLLQQVASKLRAATRPTDLIARLSGDEFAAVVALPHAAETSEMTHAATAIGQRFLHAVNAATVPGRALNPQISIGIAICGQTADPETLQREADLAMYAAKQAGGNQIRIVDDITDMLRPVVTTNTADPLQEALSRGEFQLHYQPIVETRGGRLFSVEALVRWAHPSRGLLTPNSFLPDAERTGFIATLGEWVLDEACRQLAAWDHTVGSAAPRYINVNLATRQLNDPSLTEQVQRILHRHGLAPHRLRLELPESATLGDMTAATSQLGQLRALGISVVLDDIGTGASSLQHISAIPVDGVKIDLTFIAGMLTNPTDAAIVQLLVQLGRALNIRVTAEGVETREQLRHLADLGCPYVQGYYLARPTDAATFTDWLTTYHASKMAAAPISHAARPTSGV
jgi:diguanylate cyclase (GGDEF)-like protein